MVRATICLRAVLRSLARDLFSTFPIAGVDLLGKSLHTEEAGGFSDARDLILETSRKSVIKTEAEGGIAPIKLGGVSIELYDVFSQALIVLHRKVGELGLGISNWVCRSKTVFEFVDELVPVSTPERRNRSNESGFKPIKSSAAEIRESEANFVLIVRK